MEKKREAVNAYLVKNSKGEGKKNKSHSHKQSEGLGGVLWMYKVGLKRVSETDGEKWREGERKGEESGEETGAEEAG